MKILHGLSVYMPDHSNDEPGWIDPFQERTLCRIPKIWVPVMWNPYTDDESSFEEDECSFDDDAYRLCIENFIKIQNDIKQDLIILDWDIDQIKFWVVPYKTKIVQGDTSIVKINWSRAISL